MADGGRELGTKRPLRALTSWAVGLASVPLLFTVGVLNAPPASAVSTRVPTAIKAGSFEFGKAPVGPEITRRVVATPVEPANPLSLLFRIASGTPAPPTQVIGSAPASTPAPQVTSPSTAPAPYPPGLPPAGKAWAWGCAAAIQYLEAYAAPEFSIQCPGDGDGHQATTTCISGATLCSLGASIVISDPCPAAYMNEAWNTWVLLGYLHAPIDPFGRCP